MRLISLQRGEKESGIGVMVDDTGFADLTEREPELPKGLRRLLELGEPALARVRELADAGTIDARLEDVTLLPVIPDALAIWCIGLNYDDHRIETGRDVTEQPTVFMRFVASQVAHREPMIRPKASRQLDYEGELAVIIGKRGRHIPEKEAMEYVAGYSCYNDGSVRDYQRHTSQFGPGKNFVATGGFGPWLLTADELPNPYQQTLVTRVNGEELQRVSIELMIFKIEKLINYLSTLYPLQPGDVISTGTPSGVGFKRNPPRWLVPGDTVTVDISGVGVLENPVIEET